MNITISICANPGCNLTEFLNIWIENNLHVFGEQTGIYMKTVMYQTNVKSQELIYKALFQHKSH